MKKKRYIIICLIFLLLLIIGYSIFHLIIEKKTNIASENTIIDKKEKTFKGQEEVGYVEIVGDLTSKQQIIAFLDDKKVLVYEATNEQLNSIDLFEQLDIDHDGKEEIIISADRRSNDFNDKILFILKQNNDEYTPLDLVYSDQETNSGFIINAYLDNQASNILIKNSAYDKTYSIPLTDHYRNDVFTDNGSSLYELFKQKKYQADETIGGQTKIQEFTVVTKDEYDYLVAQQDVEGALGPSDLLGSAYTTFFVKDNDTIYITDFKFEKN